ncbi:uncharacterized protein EV420DRAFT_1757938 [Desarmillaria tabescens]|uniref:J domain-containing protein n=1 Tax=Armillaria tabescens TaxID=1929756 RepID=A0AA39NRD4_ARMTA|nr:uncharacterized protein EV420DRAFT_1757938 [Desarmillaria tabescens]KAK0470416.1 hypothetical protein EV420DRAFT_1757938 [Desarmillaria tabescens]
MGNGPSVVQEGSGGPSSFGDFYTVLSVEKDATSDQIRKAYLKKVVETHPDKNLEDAEGANRRFRLVKRAYDVLMDDDDRRRYNLYPEAFHREVSDCDDNARTAAENRADASEYPAAPGGWRDNIDEDEDDDDEGDGQQYHFFPGAEPRFSPESSFAEDDDKVSFEDLIIFLYLLDGMSWTADEDHPKSVFNIVPKFFAKLVEDELQWSGKQASSYPSFGDAHSVFDLSTYANEERANISGPEVRRFYTFWSKFQTAKRFEWFQPVHCPNPYCMDDPRCQRFCRKMNKKCQDMMRIKYNEIVKVAVMALRDSDPRYKAHLYRKSSGLYYSSSSVQKLDEERQRQKQKKRDRKKKGKKGKW